MRHEYKKPNICINYCLVSSDHLERLYKFFSKRFPDSTIEIHLDTLSGHKRIYETYHEYLEDITKLLNDSEVVSEISITEREGAYMTTYKQMGISISFGNHSGSRVYIVGGDNDGSNNDWIEGTYSEMLKLKESFEIKDEDVKKILDKKYNKITFDPDGRIQEEITNLINTQKALTTPPTKVELVNNKNPQYHPWWGKILISVAIAGIIYYLGWN